MAIIFIFHGTGGFPEENWFPWLKGQLESLGHQVIIPQFPTPENQTLENWFKIFEKYRGFYISDAILIGHSLGGSFLLRVLERFNIKIQAAFIVAAPIGILPIKNFEGDKPFIGHPFDWTKIKARSHHFSVFHSDDDPYVSLGNGKKLAEKLGTELTFIPHAGHFNKAAGFTQFPKLLERIKKSL